MIAASLWLSAPVAGDLADRENREGRSALS